MIGLGIIISLLIGYSILQAVLDKSIRFSWELKLALSLSLGLAVSALLTFYCLLIAGEFNRTMIILINLTFMIVLTVLGPKRTLSGIPSHSSLKEYAFNTANIFIWVMLYFLISDLSLSHPYGQWDAWALWNMKTKFIVLSGRSWPDIFQLHWHTQPDYPLLLPLINAWLYAVSNAELSRIAMTTATLFSVLTGILIFAALKQYIPPLCALGAGLVLTTNRFYLFIGTAQYADIILAHYLLAAFILIFFSLKEQNARINFLTGLFLGILCFAKNEGVTMAVILGCLLLFFCWRNKHFSSIKRTCMASLFQGLAWTLPPSVILKTFFTPANRDISVDTLKMLPQLINAQRIEMILEYFIRSVLDEYWQYIWLLVILLIVLSLPQLRRRELKLGVYFLVAYFLVVGVIYLTTVNFDLLWRLSRTVPRVLFCLLPTIFFMSFYAAWVDPADPMDVEEKKGIIIPR